MKTIATALVCLTATLLLASPSPAEEERRVKLLLANNPDAGLISIETGELTVGETRSFTSENGYPVQLTRTESGYEIEVDGKTTKVALPPASGERFEFETSTDEEPGPDGQKRQRVIVRSVGDGKFHFNSTGNGEGAPHIVLHGDPAGKDGKDGKEVRIIRLDGKDGAPGDGELKKVHVMLGGDADLAAARAKLIASGALEGLDEATRQRILAALDGKE